MSLKKIPRKPTPQTAHKEPKAAAKGKTMTTHDYQDEETGASMSEEPGDESTGATADEPTPPPAAPELAGLSPNQKIAFIQSGAVPPSDKH